MSEQQQKTELKRPEELAILWEIDKNFPSSETPGLEQTANQFRNWAEVIGMMEPVEQLRIWVFPKGKFWFINHRLKELGFTSEVEFPPRFKGHVRSWRGSPEKAEILLPFESQDKPEIINQRLKHELAHLLSGSSKEESFEGKTEEEICRLLGISPEEYKEIRKKVERGNIQLTSIFTAGFSTYLVGMAKEEKVKYLVSGYGLEEEVVDWVAEQLFDLRGGRKIASRLASIVGGHELLYAFLTGDLEGLKKVFLEKKGFNFAEITGRLDEASDILAEEGDQTRARKEAESKFFEAEILLRIEVRKGKPPKLEWLT